MTLERVECHYELRILLEVDSMLIARPVLGDNG